MRSFLDAKMMAKSLRQALADRKIDLSHGDCLELVAKQFGFQEWNMLAARLGELKPDEKRLKLPSRWQMSGSVVPGTTHQLGLDPTIPGAALVKSLVPRAGEIDLTGKIAVLLQNIGANEFVGKRLKLTAYLRTGDADIGTIYMNVSGAQGTMRFDNLLSRETDGPLKGTHDWTLRTIVLDVPQGAECIHYGFFLKGYGKVWARSFELTAVEDDIAPTAVHSQYLDRPANLDFSQAM
ncbi:glyoxalase superfamily protein [Ensifer sp. 4252]|uniref:glyoxalase superfamily protein n=1 Tax=Ensifer sp. 4252 TaxID=3373915 RepID=UPI003D23C81A